MTFEKTFSLSAPRPSFEQVVQIQAANKMDRYIQNHQAANQSVTHLGLMIAVREATGAPWRVCQTMVEEYCSRHALTFPHGKSADLSTEVKRMVKRP